MGSTCAELKSEAFSEWYHSAKDSALMGSVVMKDEAELQHPAKSLTFE